MTEHPELAWAIVGGLFMIVGFFVAGWMNNTSQKVDGHAEMLIEHEKAIAILQKEAAEIAFDIKEIKDSINRHVEREELFQEEIRQLMHSVIENLSKQRHA